MLDMLSFALVGVATQLVTASPVKLAKRASPAVYLAGDSTMARLGGNNGKTDGSPSTQHPSYDY